MKFEVFYKKIADGRAESMVDLVNDYLSAGTFEATDRRHLERILAATVNSDSKLAGVTRRVTIGDVVLQGKDAFIYTSLGAWASVKVLR